MGLTKKNTDNYSSNHDKQDILVIDDTADNLRILSSILARVGYKVRKALNWQMAFTACQSQLPDLILLDIMMPQIDGNEICERFKAN
ncbi:MAG: response regulator, partial [Rivularia sp. ALOHA_DT_140]|nr:response regulator [Rivularia sp. ALOHA_DT_140]